MREASRTSKQKESLERGETETHPLFLNLLATPYLILSLINFGMGFGKGR
jgi:hypothetical protein